MCTGLFTGGYEVCLSLRALLLTKKKKKIDPLSQPAAKRFLHQARLDICHIVNLIYDYNDINTQSPFFNISCQAKCVLKFQLRTPWNRQIY